MIHDSLRSAVNDLERHGHLVRVRVPVDPDLELAEIQRRLYAAQGPAVLFETVRGTPFPAVCNLYGTRERARFLFRRTWETVRRIVQLKADPSVAWRAPLTFARTPFVAFQALPRRVGRGPVLRHATVLSKLPAVRSWPLDGGPFVTLPQVVTRDPARPLVRTANVGMYRVQLAGNAYERDREVGLHFQIQRGIGPHVATALERGQTLPVAVGIGGPPAYALAAVMPLPEGLSELLFAGMLAGRRVRYALRHGAVLPVDWDFAIVGELVPGETKPEGPFGDHLGYYSLQHEFPVLRVKEVLHREGAIWPFTVVGRPPQEDTTFGALIHELTAPMVPKEIPGLHEMHAVDAAGVHPLMLAIGSERYVPHGERHPQELLTIANAILGFGQASLAKFLVIAAREDDPRLTTHDEGAFLRHVFERIDWRRDLHFQTRTTIDTLDYSGTGLNEGSKVVLAAAGKVRRRLCARVPPLPVLPAIRDVRLALPGVLVLEGPAWSAEDAAGRERLTLLAALEALDDAALAEVALLVLVDDAAFTARTLRNFLWVTFTRTNPAHDVDGVHAAIEHKHWGCRGPLLVDARIKTHHAPPLVEDPEITRRVDALAARGGPLHGLLG